MLIFLIIQIMLLCREIKEFLEFILLNTQILWDFIISLVKILVVYKNPQITKAQSVNFKLEIKEFFELCMFLLRNNNNFNSLNIIYPKLNKSILVKSKYNSNYFINSIKKSNSKDNLYDFKEE